MQANKGERKAANMESHTLLHRNRRLGPENANNTLPAVKER